MKTIYIVTMKTFEDYNENIEVKAFSNKEKAFEYFEINKKAIIDTVSNHLINYGEDTKLLELTDHDEILDCFYEEFGNDITIYDSLSYFGISQYETIWEYILELHECDLQ